MKFSCKKSIIEEIRLPKHSCVQGQKAMVPWTASTAQAQEVTPCCCHGVTNVAPQLAELYSRRIWPRPKEGADSIALLGAGLPGSQAQWAGLTCESHSYRLGPGLVAKGARAPDAVCSWSHSLSQAGSQENREHREGVSPLPWALFCSRGKARKAHTNPGPAHTPSRRCTWRKTATQN